MIYRPAPVTEVKAAIIDEQLRSIILADRAASVPNHINLDDPGFVPAEGRLTAIKRRVAALQAQKARLLQQVPTRANTTTTENLEQDVIDAES
jgi:hypothetical protein